MMNHNHQGFTLMEMVVIVAIIAIMASIAIPSYQDSLRKSRRADAQVALVGLAAALERHNTINGAYTGAGTVDNDTGAPTIYPSTSPSDGSTAYYQLTIKSADASTFELRATPIETTSQKGNGFLSLNQLGQKKWDKNNNASIDADDVNENKW